MYIYCATRKNKIRTRLSKFSSYNLNIHTLLSVHDLQAGFKNLSTLNLTESFCSLFRIIFRCTLLRTKRVFLLNSLKSHNITLKLRSIHNSEFVIDIIMFSTSEVVFSM